MIEPNTLLQNRYLIVQLISKGGMGAVYLATDQRLRSTVALKETFFDDESLRKAFEREARLLASLHHPSLPLVMDYFAENNKEFLVMQYIPGQDLAEIMKNTANAFPPSEVLDWADQLLNALDYLHTQPSPIIHRDIKPQNLKLADRKRIILLDFGLAKGTAGLMSQASSAGSIFGYTPHYAPIEQIQGKGTDARSDLYSLAATLYHLMTGMQPPDAVSRASAVINGDVDPLRPANDVKPNIPANVASVLMQAMDLKRSHRPATADEMRKMLRDVSQALTTTHSSRAETMGMERTVPGSFPTNIQTVGETPGLLPNTATDKLDQQAGQTIPYSQTLGRKIAWNGPFRKIALLLVTILTIVVAGLASVLWWYGTKEARQMGRPSSQVGEASPDDRQYAPVFKVDYPVVNGLWKYEGWDRKRLAQKPTAVKNRLEEKLHSLQMAGDSVNEQRSKAWHAIHLYLPTQLDPKANTPLNSGSQVLTCSSCHRTFNPLDRETPRQTCGECHITE